ncbi:MAG: hypothetical protein DSZ28_01150 [Thiothrix sp.]|nr:MAG: hypothetical protein DSZ28_01150 [Thiothrix sp.]
MRLTAMTYNLMRVVEEVSKVQNPDLIHSSDKKYTQTVEKRQQAARKKGRFVNVLVARLVSRPCRMGNTDDLTRSFPPACTISIVT